MLDVKKINLNYGSSQILFDVSIKAKKGNITCLMGSNGVGKTSLLKFLSGIQNAKNGTYFYNNNDIFNLPSYKLAKLGIGYVPQGKSRGHAVWQRYPQSIYPGFQLDRKCAGCHRAESLPQAFSAI